MRFLCTAILVCPLMLAACASESGAPDGPPSGWAAADGQWWVEGTDTSGVYRNLDSLSTMGVTLAEDEYGRWVQQQLLPLYRTNPDVLDSLFQAVAVPMIDASQAEGTAAGAVLEEVKQAFLELYRQPVADPADAPSISMPDGAGSASGRSVIQVRVEPTGEQTDQGAYIGEPVAIEVLQSVHPVVDAQLMRAASERTYYAGYVITDPRTNENEILGGWVRLSRTFE